MRLSWSLAFCCLVSILHAQLSPAHRDYLNQQIAFMNESVHGMLVAQRIYEDYNQQINRYVDLPSYSINNFTNDDLPDDIFQDQENWFYQNSPKEIYEKLNINPLSSTFYLNTTSVIQSSMSTIDFINKDRTDIEAIIKSEDLNSLASIQTIYKEFEEAISHYDRFRSNIERFEGLILEEYHAQILPDDKKQVYRAFIEITYDIKKVLRHIRKDNQSQVIAGSDKIDKEIKWLETCIGKLKDANEKQALTKIFNTLQFLADDIQSYFRSPSVPPEYAVFGKGYYYHNVRLLTKTNRYGNGYISELNDFFRTFDWDVIHFLEEPHFLKIVYPERIPLETLKDPNADPTQNIKTMVASTITPEPAPPSIPQTKTEKIMEEMEEQLEQIAHVVEKPMELGEIIESKTIYVDSQVFDLFLFDFKITDGDRVSVNINGEWVYTNISLEKEPRKVTISLRPNEENYIMIKADNEGFRPPNTLGIRYISNGKAQNVVLMTDLNTTERIQIKYRSS